MHLNRPKDDNRSSNAIKVVLIDTGEILFLTYSKGKLFEIPNEFTKIPSQAIPLKIHAFPKSFSSVNEFIEKTLITNNYSDAVGVKARVISVVNNVVHVDVIDSSYQTHFIKFENNHTEQNVLKLTKSNLEKLINKKKTQECFKYSNSSVMASDIAEKTKLPALGSRVLINSMMVVHPYLIYGQVREINIHIDRDNYELINLMMRLNNFERKHEPLKSKPILNQMVIVSMDVQFENNKRKYYRGKVHEIFDNVFMVRSEVYFVKYYSF